MLVPDREVRGAFFVRVGGTDQSFVDPADPTRLEFDYAQRMADVIDTIAPAGERIRVVHVGGAGMSLPRYVAATRPRSAQIVLEPDAAMTEEVRRVLPLPRQSGIKVRPVDGRTGLAAMPADYCDLVIIDAFAGAQVPAELCSTEWFAEVARVLDDAGTVTMNLTDQAPFTHARRVVATMAATFRPVVVATEPATLKGNRFGNLIVSAGGAAVVGELERRARTAAFPYRLLAGQTLERWIGPALPFTDANTEPSPQPVGGPMTFR
ncbi:MAG TPA: fused MFS/spermidine synthase [Propionibacteriaceae bacterium]|nr:fused MFS/spermidine synthase [Propionibacteriaceae bacterium]